MVFQSKALIGYNKASIMQLVMNLEALPLLTHYLHQVSSLSEETLRITDYGCSEGFNSMQLFSKAFQEFRQYSTKPIFILHTDLPENDWATFFDTMNNSSESYLTFDNIFFSALGRSFYN